MNPIDAAIVKENKRVSYEWDELMRKHGESYDTMTEEGKLAACDLAEKQGYRFVKIMERFQCACT